MIIREPAVAGRFYSGDRAGCEAELRECLDRAARPSGSAEPVPDEKTILGGIVPHAGWICSGAVAARVFKAIADSRQPAAIVIFGAIHVPHGPAASLFDGGAWETPLGLAEVDARLANRLHSQTGLMEVDPHAHENEHSIEVEVPFIQQLMPNTMIVPIMVPPNENAVPLGAAIGRTAKSYGADVVFIASTDLTHYGPGYGFLPHGRGGAGLRWAKEVNDRRMIDAIRALRESEVVDEAKANQNACGAGAVAATLAACRACGATRATLLEPTTSFDVLSDRYPEPMTDAVGYAAMLIH
ncbi:MAG: AmmeMemoRadiSam system protein B [Planctomycetota bacterium]|nr:AmmeMemoRadiSam system protein B [Planctomycetota bacterium]